MYDYIVIGAGVIGAFISQELSKYNVKTLVIEKETDVANETTAANSAIIHSGYDPEPGTLKAKLNVEGNKMYPKICEYYGIEFRNIGSLTVAFDDEEVEKLGLLEERAKINGVEMKRLSREEVLDVEPNINSNIKAALLAPSAGIVYPWEITFALMDHAISNGVELKLKEKVIGIEKTENGYIVKTTKGTYETKNIINASGVHGSKVKELVEKEEQEIRPRRGEYFVLSRGADKYVNHVIFPIPTKRGKGILANPISEREILLGPTSDFIDDFEDVSTTEEMLDYIRNEVKKTMNYMPSDKIMRSFSGLRASSKKGDFIIEESKENTGLFHVIGIESPGLASAPAISKYVADLAKFDKLNKKSDFKEYTPTTRVTHLRESERIEKIKENEDYGRIVCRCENISLQEIKDAIKGNVGATTIKGIKKRVRPGSGGCQGGFCEPEIVKILSQELGVDITEVLFDKEGSEVLVGRSKEDFLNE